MASGVTTARRSVTTLSWLWHLARAVISSQICSGQLAVFYGGGLVLPLAAKWLSLLRASASVSGPSRASVQDCLGD